MLAQTTDGLGRSAAAANDAESPSGGHEMSLEIASRRSPSAVAGLSSLRAATLTASVSRQAGGLFWSVRALSRSLIDSGCDVRVFGGEDAYSSEDRDKWGQTPVTVLPTVGARAFVFQRGLKNALSAYRPDLLHVEGLWIYRSTGTGALGRR